MVIVINRRDETDRTRDARDGIAVNGSLCGRGSELGGRVGCASEAECSAYAGSFPLNSAYRRSEMKA